MSSNHGQLQETKRGEKNVRYLPEKPGHAAEKSIRESTCVAAKWRQKNPSPRYAQRGIVGLSATCPSRAHRTVNNLRCGEWRVNNPLNVVKTSIYYLVNARQPPPEKVRQHLERIERQVELADRVITALSDFARLPIPELRPLCVENCLKEVLELNAMPEAITVKLDFAPNLPPVLGDVRQLQIVFGNLVRNARDAMPPESGTLTVTARSVEDDLAITVADTGVGIARESLARILEPLYSTKARGIGLGLAITRSIIDKHGGRLHVASEVGAGSQFTVRLPAAHEGSVDHASHGARVQGSRKDA